jgi:hypothetical protein
VTGDRDARVEPANTDKLARRLREVDRPSKSASSRA